MITLLSGVGIGSGFSACIGLNWWLNRATRLRAEREASELVQEAQVELQQLEESQRLQFEEIQAQEMGRFEQESVKLQQRNHSLEERISERQEQISERLANLESLASKKDQLLRQRQSRFDSFEQRLNAVRQRNKKLQQELHNLALERSPLKSADLKTKIIEEIHLETQTRAQKLALEIEQDMQINVEREAKRIIGVILNRFARPYCPERGIGNVNFPHVEAKERLLSQNRKLLNCLEQLCGVDIVINEQYQSASVMGFDPVRRELGRASLERAVAERHLDEQKLETIVTQCKKTLYKKIAQDGQNLMRELRMTDMHEDVRWMLGALRYRYSFAQNQYFHVAEVGWLCGLLAAELGVQQKDGRRSGVLHDVGKAMDHTRDGGHAVIGAEFIEKHGERAEIVHAVRAHHYDEQPASDLAFLTIAADALSGARPGARRSTMDSYTQKMADLEKIGNSFDGVIATYILSAGREIRCIVDSAKMTDLAALDLSRRIAQKIEQELSYPGLIKVTVVRETQAIEMAR